MNQATLRTLVLPAVLLVAVAVAIGIFATLSTTEDVSAEGAVVQNMGHNSPTGDASTCSVPGVDDYGDLLLQLHPGEPLVVVENNRWIKLVCQAPEVSNGSGSGQTFTEGFACRVFSPKAAAADEVVSYTVTNLSLTVSSSGIGTLHCTVDLNVDEPNPPPT